MPKKCLTHESTPLGEKIIENLLMFAHLFWKKIVQKVSDKLSLKNLVRPHMQCSLDYTIFSLILSRT